MSQLPPNATEKVGKSVAVATEVGTSERAASCPKKHSMLKEKCLPSPITLPKYMWVNIEMGIYFSCYNHKSDLTNLISWRSISDMMNLKTCPITLRTIRSYATSLVEFVFMNQEGMNRDFFYMYDCLFRNLHVMILP
ncbi:hypothetical protein AAZX31_06G231200 [Glycine max]